MHEKIKYAYFVSKEIRRNNIMGNCNRSNMGQRECGERYEHDRFHMVCPSCGSPFTQLVAGKELRIDSIEVDVPDEEQDGAAE